MSVQTASLFGFDFFDAARPIQVEFSPALLTSDAGLLPIRQFDEKVKLTQQFADALHDPRNSALIEHSMLEMTRMRVYGLIAGYEDQNDHDVLRTDPVFKLINQRSPDDPHLASQPTLSRFENQIDIPSLKRLRDLFIDQFIASFASPPMGLMFDIDAVDDATHGSQQLTLFHGYYEQYQYLPLLITSADTDLLVTISLRHGTASASMGADDDLEYLVTRLRATWPGVQIRVRGDCGLGVPTMHELCDRLGIFFIFGQTANVVLQRESKELLVEAERLWSETHQPQRLFKGFWYRAGSWSQRRWVIVKAEANAQGTNQRFVTTNRPWSEVYLEATYDEYAMRGESENRNKEYKCGMKMDRLSDHRFMANYFRLYLCALALNLIVRLRREIALPPMPEPLAATAVSGLPEPSPEIPVSALPEPARKQYQNARRRHDPLGEGHPATWRTMLIKVAGSVVVSCRRIVIRISSSWPNWEFLQRVSEHVSRRPSVSHIFTG